MKKSLSALFLLFSVALIASEYNFTALGDIHYDGEKYHVSPPSNATRKLERKRNFGMWKSGRADAVLAAAAKAACDNKSAFVVQLGDLIQGYCENTQLQEMMFVDGYPRVRGYFPDHKFYAIRGNHDAKIEKMYINTPAEKEFFPRVAKELGRKSLAGTYTIRHGKDLFIFFDGFYGSRKSVADVRQALESNPDARYVFFLTHLPVLTCSVGNPGWLIPAVAPISKMLAKVNAVILTAHTHLPSFVSLDTPDGALSQMVVSSIGSSWFPDKPQGILYANFDEFAAAVDAKRLAKKNTQAAFKAIRSSRINGYTIYSNNSGFVVVKVNDKEVTAEVYTDNSGKPALTKVLRKNAKVEDKK